VLRFRLTSSAGVGASRQVRLLTRRVRRRRIQLKTGFASLSIVDRGVGVRVAASRLRNRVSMLLECVQTLSWAGGCAARYFISLRAGSRVPPGPASGLQGMCLSVEDCPRALWCLACIVRPTPPQSWQRLQGTYRR